MMDGHFVRMLWVPYSQYGSAFPAVPYVQEMLRKGHSVFALMSKELLAAVPKHPNLHLVHQLRDPHIWGTPRRHLTRDPLALLQRIRGEIVDVTHAVHEVRPDVILSDPLVPGAGLAGERLGIPHVSYVPFMKDESQPFDELFRKYWDNGTDPAVRFRQAWNTIRNAVGLDDEPRPIAQAQWWNTSPICTLLMTHPLLRSMPRALPNFVHVAAPVPWDTHGDVEPLPFERTQDGRPTVVVATSTEWQNDIDLVHAANRAGDRLGCTVISTVGADHDISGISGAVGMYPHTRLLPKADVVIGVGGMGVTTKAIHYRRPLVINPRVRDTPQVAAAVERLELGVVIDDASPAAVERALQYVFENTATFEERFDLMDRTLRRRAVQPEFFPRLVEIALGRTPGLATSADAGATLERVL
jgi:UDP:flavonoid glycosyltransferase YjiC (YdhE family)